MTSPDGKLTLPAFLKVLTSDKLPMPKAMAIAGKVYKTHNTPAALAGLTDGKLKSLGVDAKDDRKSALAAFKKAGFGGASGSSPKKAGAAVNAIAGPSSKSKQKSGGTKRKREEVLEDLLPEGPKDESAAFGSFEFNEVLDEEVLRTKFVVVNRAPVMTAWAMVVAERLGFKREEALSIASAYTEMNAISKGVSLGIFEKSRADGVELTRGASETQPYVEFMGRRIPLYTSQSGQWRALVKSEPISPGTAFAYMTNAFRQTLPFVIGSLRLLAESYSPTWLNEHGFTLYRDFRPGAERWGDRAEMKCAKVLELRKKRDPKEVVLSDEKKGEEREKTEQADGLSVQNVSDEGLKKDDQSSKDPPEDADLEPVAKRVKSMSVEEYEAALDESDPYGVAFWDEAL